MPFEFKASTSLEVIENTFRYSNSWHTQTGYHSSIQEALLKVFQRNPLHILLSRLKEIKSALKNWRNEKKQHS